MASSPRNAHLARRHRAERRFRLYGLLALGFAASMLLVLLVSVGEKGVSGFTRHEVRVDVAVVPPPIGGRLGGGLPQTPHSISAPLPTSPHPPLSSPPLAGGIKGGMGEGLTEPDYYTLTQRAIYTAIGTPSPDVKTKREVAGLVGFFAAAEVKDALQKRPEGGAVWVPLSDIGDLAMKGSIDRLADPLIRPISDQQLAWLDTWKAEGRIRRSFNPDFFTHGDSRAPEAAGFGGSIIGSLFTVLICMAAALPIAVMAAITLEEFAAKSRLAEWLEITINNLAAVPSIIYGLLGLTVFIQCFGMPRSSPLVGGLTLALLVMPVMIIAARAAIRAVPPSMRQAAAALGATPLQVVRHHVLPYALPGIMTGTILSVARAIGESAPLLMIGMVAFVADVPRSPLDAATAMPVQIFIWASSPQLGYAEKTSAGIIVLLLILLILNALAITVRKRSQLSWG